MARNKIDYQFTAVPTHLFLCMDNNCRSTLISLIQLSTYYENKNGTAFDGWFFRTNALLEEETNLSKNVLSGALDALYQAGIIDIKSQEKGRGKSQGARSYKVIFDSFLKYEQIPFEECSCQHPECGIVTSDYKKGAPKFQQRPQLEEQPQRGKSDNNIDSIDNTEISDSSEKENIYNIDKSIISNNLDISSHFDVNLNSEVEVGIDKEEEPHSNYRCDDSLKSVTSTSSDNLGTSTHNPADLNLPTPFITSEFIDSQIPFVYSKVSRQGETQELDNYTDAAYDILDEYGKEVSNWMECIKSKTTYCDSAMARLVETINGREYSSQADCEKTALDLMDYAANREAQYRAELYSKIHS